MISVLLGSLGWGHDLSKLIESKMEKNIKIWKFLSDLKKTILRNNTSFHTFEPSSVMVNNTRLTIKVHQRRMTKYASILRITHAAPAVDHANRERWYGMDGGKQASSQI